MGERKIIPIHREPAVGWYALADDGTVWIREAMNPGRWRLADWPELPQPAATSRNANELHRELSTPPTP